MSTFWQFGTVEGHPACLVGNVRLVRVVLTSHAPGGPQSVYERGKFASFGEVSVGREVGFIRVVLCCPELPE